MINVNFIDKMDMYDLYNSYIKNPKEYEKITRRQMAKELIEYYKNNIEEVVDGLPIVFRDKLNKISQSGIKTSAWNIDDVLNDLECMLFIYPQIEVDGRNYYFNPELKQELNQYFSKVDSARLDRLVLAEKLLTGLVSALGFVNDDEIKEVLQHLADLNDSEFDLLLRGYWNEDVERHSFSFQDGVTVYGLRATSPLLTNELIDEFEMFRGPYKRFSKAELLRFAELSFDDSKEEANDLLVDLVEKVGELYAPIIMSRFVHLHNTSVKSTEIIDEMVEILDTRVLRIKEGYETIKKMITFSALHPKWIYKGYSEKDFVENFIDEL